MDLNRYEGKQCFKNCVYGGFINKVFAYWEIVHAFLSSADFFKINFFEKKKKISGTPSEFQTVLIQIRPDILSGLIWVQTACKGYQQTTLVGK